jgi:hypothetical protein
MKNQNELEENKNETKYETKEEFNQSSSIVSKVSQGIHRFNS